MSHVKASEKVLFKNKPSETPEGAAGSALWPFRQTHLKLLQQKLKTRLDKKVVSMGFIFKPGLGLSPPPTPQHGGTDPGGAEHHRAQQVNAAWLALCYRLARWTSRFSSCSSFTGEKCCQNSPACFSMERLLRMERTARAFGRNHIPQHWSDERSHHPLTCQPCSAWQRLWVAGASGENMHSCGIWQPPSNIRAFFQS